MAASNRYSQITPSQFNPLSLEEVMMVPMMKRQQHDALNSKIESQIAELAKVKPTDRDFTEAQKEKQRLNDMMMSQAERLTKEGVNPNSQSDFLKFNRDFQESISPTGKIGMFNEAYIQKAKKEAEFLDNHVKLGYSPKEALAKLEKAKQDYMNTDIYDEQGRVTMFNTDKYMAPNYINHIEEARKFMNDTKMDSREWDKITSGIVIDDNGQYVHTGGTSGLRADNHAKIEAVLGFMNSRMSPTGDIGQVLDWRGYDKQQALNEIQSMSGIYKQKAIKDGTTSQISNFNPNEGTSQAPSGMIISNDSTLTTDALNETNYQNVIKTINQLQSSKSLSPADRAKLEDLKELKSIADSKISKDSKYSKVYNEYQTELNKWKNLANKMDLTKEEKQQISENPNILPQLLFGKGFGFFKGDKKDKDLNLIMNDKSLTKFNSLNKEKQSIQDTYWKQSSSLRHNYTYLPSTLKEESAWNLHNENVLNTLNGIPDLGNILDLTSVHTTGGTRKDVNSNDVKNIQNLLKSGDPKSFKINNIKTYGDNKTPEITMTFTTKKGAKEYDIDGSWDWNDEYGGEEKPVTVTFKLKKFSNAFDTKSAVGYKNLTGAIANFWKDKGGVNEITGNFQGAEIYNSMIENAYSDISNEELYQRAQVDSDAREALMIRIAKRKSK